MLEEWKVFDDGEHKLLVSNFGNVLRWVNKKPLHVRSDSLGYRTVRVHKDYKEKNYKVHRLVAKCFIDNPENKPNVNHKDGIKYNNLVTNLEWVTQKENVRHAFDTGLISRSGSKNSKAKINEERVHQICKWFEDNPTCGPLAASEVFGINAGLLAKIRNCQNWKSIRSQYSIPPLTSRAKFND